MHFSPFTIGVTALFILARLATASFDHVDIGAAPANPGQLKPAYLRLAPHHHHESDENSFVSHYHRHRLADDYYPSKEKKQWPGAGNQAAATKKAQAQSLRSKLRQLEAPRPPPTTFCAADNRGKALFGRALEKSHSTLPSKGVKVSYGNLAQLDKQNCAIGAKTDEAGREQQDLQRALSGTGGAASGHFAQRKAKTANFFKQSQGLYQQPLFGSSSYSATEGRAKALWGRSPMESISAAQSHHIISLIDSGHSAHQIASITGVNVSTISRLQSKHRPNNNMQDQRHQSTRG